MKEYEVLFTERIVYRTYVNAGSKEEAEQLFYDTDIRTIEDYDVVWTEISVQEV